MAVEIVWFKRDLRLADHRPLFEAAARGRPVVPLYVVEPAYWRLPDASARHWHIVREALAELAADLFDAGSRLIVRVGAVPEILADLHSRHGVSGLWSHEETGNLWTFARDRDVLAWARSASVPWEERAQFGVIRGLKNRDGWARRWDRFMAEPVTEQPRLPPVPGDIASHPIPDAPVPFRPDQLAACPDRQAGTRHTARATLHGFLEERGEPYRTAMSTPVQAFDACSRLSVPLSVGTLSMRETAQAAWARQAAVRRLPRDERGRWPGAIDSFIGRLHWHCHFIQKLENAPRFEVENVHRGYDGMRPDGAHPDRLAAWADGRTGLPFVDACMRALTATGWMNFRMRAMLMATASYHLWLGWRESGLHLARLFSDYEPGIHWNQSQMQSGTTGINTVRIYNPVKQGHDQDPTGDFVRRWVPELAAIPDGRVHEPWALSPLERADFGLRLGHDYPERIVDHQAAAKEARQTIWAIRKHPAFREEADRIQQRHGSRKSGLPQTTDRRRAARRARDGKASEAQAQLDFS